MKGKLAKSYLRDHEIEYVDGKWIYSDTKESTVGNERPCGYCGLMITLEGHDGCLETLPGIMNACCGHGQAKDTYVQFMDGFSIHGEDAMIIINILKKNR